MIQYGNPVMCPICKQQYYPGFRGAILELPPNVIKPTMRCPKCKKLFSKKVGGFSPLTEHTPMRELIYNSIAWII